MSHFEPILLHYSCNCQANHPYHVANSYLLEWWGKPASDFLPHGVYEPVQEDYREGSGDDHEDYHRTNWDFEVVPDLAVHGEGLRGG